MGVYLIERKIEMKINEDRCYVLLSIKWTRKGTLMFWGTISEDDNQRSFGGYTDDINTCERYTFEEARSERVSHYNYNDETLTELMNIDRDGTWIVHIKDLRNLGKVVMNYVY